MVGPSGPIGRYCTSAVGTGLAAEEDSVSAAMHSCAYHALYSCG